MFLDTMAVLAITLGIWVVLSYECYTEHKGPIWIYLLSPFIGGVILLLLGIIIVLMLIAASLTFFTKLKRFTILSLVSSAFIISPSKWIETESNPFWTWAIRTLNQAGRDNCYIYKLGFLYVRDPHSHPMHSYWGFSKYHPFMYKKGEMGCQE